MTEKKLLGIVGSYRNVGNAEIVTKAVAEKLEGWELSMIRLPKLSLQPCKACYACLIPGKKCNLPDDMQWLIERILEADAVIIAAPNYVLGPAGMVKMMADRALQASYCHEKFRAKKTAVALTLGREDYRGYADTALAAQAAALGLRVAGVELFFGTHPGEVALEESFDEKISRLAVSLLADAGEAPGAPGRCPRCHSDLFRIREDCLECAVCKSRARQTGDRLDFFFFHHEFGEQGLEEHLKWLLGKKEEYAFIKDKLAYIQKRYRGGNWLTPPGKNE